jgi:hypothetical protein
MSLGGNVFDLERLNCELIDKRRDMSWDERDKVGSLLMNHRDARLPMTPWDQVELRARQSKSQALRVRKRGLEEVELLPRCGRRLASG